MMKKMREAKLTPTLLRVILIGTMLLISLLGFAIWQISYKKLASVSNNVAQIQQQADASNDSVQQLLTLKTQLDSHQDTVAKAAAIVAQSQEYKYQNQITQDLERFAQDAGVTIESYTFSNGASSGGAATTTTAPPATAAPAPAPAAGSQPSAASGLKSTTVVVTPKSPVNYRNYLKFLNDIQQNSLKMQIDGLSLAKQTDGLSSQALNIKVYTTP